MQRVWSWSLQQSSYLTPNNLCGQCCKKNQKFRLKRRWIDEKTQKISVPSSICSRVSGAGYRIGWKMVITEWTWETNHNSTKSTMAQYKEESWWVNKTTDYPPSLSLKSCSNCKTNNSSQADIIIQLYKVHHFMEFTFANTIYFHSFTSMLLMCKSFT